MKPIAPIPVPSELFREGRYTYGPDVQEAHRLLLEFNASVDRFNFDLKRQRAPTPEMRELRRHLIDARRKVAALFDHYRANLGAAADLDAELEALLGPAEPAPVASITPPGRMAVAVRAVDAMAEVAGAYGDLFDQIDREIWPALQRSQRRRLAKPSDDVLRAIHRSAAYADPVQRMASVVRPVAVWFAAIAEETGSEKIAKQAAALQSMVAALPPPPQTARRR